jgi:hypothetical protein
MLLEDSRAVIAPESEITGEEQGQIKKNNIPGQ